MKTGPFKMKGMDFGNSPLKQDPPKNLNIIGSKGIPSGENFEKYGKGYKSTKQKFKKFQSQTQKAKKWVENLKIKNVLKTGGKRVLGVLGFMGGGSLSATAGNVGEKSTGAQIKDLLTKHKLKGGK